MEKKVTRWVLSILVMAMIIAGLVSTTYALFSVDLYAPNQEVYSTGMLAITAKSKTDTISLTNALPMTDEKGVTTNPYVFTIKNIGNLAYLFDIKLLSTGDSATSFSPQYIKLKIDDGEVITLSSLINSEIKSDIVLPAGESIDISLRVWLSSDTPNSELGKGFNSKIVTSGQAMYTSTNGDATLVSKIYSLYNNAVKTEEENNGIKYNYATSVSLMNDRHDSSGNLLSDLNGGNIRYYGANPNNYIYFNCDDYSNQSSSTCELWRIIGVFKDVKLYDGTKYEIRDLIKIVHSDISNSTVKWNENTEANRNNWHNATLQTLLNTTYYNGTDFYGLNGITSKTQSKIENVIWNLGNDNSVGKFPNVAYTGERSDVVYTGNQATWPGKIALMYPSDYGYATDFSLCNSEIVNYNTDTDCTEKDWIFKKDYKQWLLTPAKTSGNTTSYILADGSVMDNFTGAVYSSNKVFRPVLFLNAEEVYVSGSGTNINPYRISE